jgi:hypothetical protein
MRLHEQVAKKGVTQTHGRGRKQAVHCVGFEVLTVVIRKSFLFWDIMLCSLLKVN